jgi:hypothetical protein
MEIRPSIIDYLGKFEGGIFVKIGLMWNDTYYDAMFYYTNDKMILTVDETMIEKMGAFIEEHPEYLDLMKSIISMVEPYEKVFDKLDDINV